MSAILFAARRHSNVQQIPAGGGGGGGDSFTATVIAAAYTPPTGMDAYGRGTAVDTTWAVSDFAGTVRTVSTAGTDANRGAALQAAIDASVDGDIVIATSGYTYDMNGSADNALTLKDRGAPTGATKRTKRVLICSEKIYNNTFAKPQLTNPEGFYDGAGVWNYWSKTKRAASLVMPSDAPNMPKITSTAAYPQLLLCGVTPGDPNTGTTTGTAGRFVLAGLYFQTPSTNPNPYYTFSFGGGGPTVLSQTPSDVIFDRCLVRGTYGQNIGRVFRDYGRGLAAILCWFDRFQNLTGDSCNVLFGSAGAVGAKLVGNYIQVPGITILAGGEDTPLAATNTMVAADWEIRFNVFEHRRYNPNDAAHSSTYKIGASQVGFKNPWESKNGKRIWYEGNYNSGSWNHQQNGSGSLWQNLHQQGTNPYNEVKDITLRYNRMWRVMSGMGIGSRIAYATDQGLARPIASVAISGGVPTFATTAAHTLETGYTIQFQESNNVPVATNSHGITGLTSTMYTVTKVDSTHFTCDGLTGTSGSYTGTMYVALFPLTPTQRIDLTHNVFEEFGNTPWTPVGFAGGWGIQMGCTDYMRVSRNTFCNAPDRSSTYADKFLYFPGNSGYVGLSVSDNILVNRDGQTYPVVFANADGVGPVASSIISSCLGGDSGIVTGNVVARPSGASAYDWAANVAAVTAEATVLPSLGSADYTPAGAYSAKGADWATVNQMVPDVPSEAYS